MRKNTLSPTIGFLLGGCQCMTKSGIDVLLEDMGPPCSKDSPVPPVLDRISQRMGREDQRRNLPSMGRWIYTVDAPVHWLVTWETSRRAINTQGSLAFVTAVLLLEANTLTLPALR
jgi:hypothetical protein